MASMVSDVFSVITNGTYTIGILADDILDGGRAINQMAGAIGVMADCIVATEVMGFDLVERFCADYHPIPPNSTNTSCPAIPPVHPPTGLRQHAVTLSVPLPRATVSHDDTSVSEGSNPFGQFAEMVKLCTKMLDDMEQMATKFTSLAGMLCFLAGVVSIPIRMP